MAMIRALPSEFDSFASSLQLLDKLEKFKLQESFIAEELRRQCTLLSPALQVASFTSHTSNSLSTISQQASTSSCDFCGLPGHSAWSCYRYKAAKVDATKEALEKRLQRKQKGRGPLGMTQKANTAQTLPSSSSTTTTTSPDSSSIQEFAGNASTSFLDPSHLLSPLQPDAYSSWTPDTGATSHMTPHHHWLHNYTPCRIPIHLADNRVVYSAGWVSGLSARGKGQAVASCRV